MSKQFEIRDYRKKDMFRVDDEYLNGYARILGTTTSMVYFVLCRHADRNQECFPSMELIGEKLGVTSRTVKTCIKKLTEWNIIKIGERRRHKNGKWMHNTYLLMDKSVWKNKPGEASFTWKPGEVSDTSQGKSDVKTRGSQFPTKVTHKKVTHKKVAETKVSRDTEEIIKLFEVVNPACSKMYGNTTQRKACENLISTYGFDEVSRVIAILPKTNSMEYMPNITTPHLLWDKYQQLKNRLVAKREERLSKKVKII